MVDQTNLQNRHFNHRIKESKIWTQMMVEYLKSIGHIKDFINATEDEDKNQLVDYWFQYNEGEEYVPIAFKLRIDPAKRDIPVVYSQPFRGFDNETTVSGRDYRCLEQNSVVQYYVAVKNKLKEYSEIYRISKNTLYPFVENIVSSWKAAKHEGVAMSFVAYEKMTETKNKSLLNSMSWGKGMKRIFSCDNAEVWWQKNPAENYSKINFYINESLKEESFKIPKEDYQKMLETYIS